MAISSLALEVHAALFALQLEDEKTLYNQPVDNLDELEQYTEKILHALNVEPFDKNYAYTARKMAWRYQELCSGLSYHRFPEIARIANVGPFEGEVILPRIPIESLCEHHFSPMVGNVQLIYMPNRYLIGFSTLVQLVTFFAHRPQLQERLTVQLRVALETVLQTDQLAVSIELNHSCMKTNGASRADSTVITRSAGKGFKWSTGSPTASLSKEKNVYGI